MGYRVFIYKVAHKDSGDGERDEKNSDICEGEVKI